MKARVVRRGNSYWLRVPKALAKVASASGEVNMRVQHSSLVIRLAKPRAGWEAAFRKAANRGDHHGGWDQCEWEW